MSAQRKPVRQPVSGYRSSAIHHNSGEPDRQTMRLRTVPGNCLLWTGDSKCSANQRPQVPCEKSTNLRQSTAPFNGPGPTDLFSDSVNQANFASCSEFYGILKEPVSRGATRVGDELGTCQDQGVEISKQGSVTKLSTPPTATDGHAGCRMPHAACPGGRVRAMGTERRPVPPRIHCRHACRVAADRGVV